MAHLRGLLEPRVVAPRIFALELDLLCAIDVFGGEDRESALLAHENREVRVWQQASAESRLQQLVRRASFRRGYLQAEEGIGVAITIRHVLDAARFVAE